jgi:hypothetical protein
VKNGTTRGIWAVVAKWVFTNHPSSAEGGFRASHSALAVLASQFQEMDGRGFSKLDAEVACDLAQRVIEMREVIDGHVANEGAADFVVAGAAVQPAKKKEHLEARGETNHDPVGIHKNLGGGGDFLRGASVQRLRVRESF